MLNLKTLLLLYFVGFSLTADTEITKSMKKFEIVPDLIDEGPKHLLIVSYDGVIVDKDIKLTPTQVKNEPCVEWKCEASTLYTLIMTNPDAPSRAEPRLREWHHWLVGNIPGNLVKNGDTLSPYVGSGPPKAKGLHRFVFLLYKQPKKLEFDEPRLTINSTEGRAKFSTRKFVEKYNLGVPIAGNFFQAECNE